MRLGHRVVPYPRGGYRNLQKVHANVARGIVRIVPWASPEDYPRHTAGATEGRRQWSQRRSATPPPTLPRETQGRINEGGRPAPRASSAFDPASYFQLLTEDAHSLALRAIDLDGHLAELLDDALQVLDPHLGDVDEHAVLFERLVDLVAHAGRQERC